MTEYIHNESTKQSPLGPRFVEAIKIDAARNFGWNWQDVATGDAYLEISPDVLIRYVAHWCRDHGVTGWSKLRLLEKDYPLTQEEIDAIKKDGAQSA